MVTTMIGEDEEQPAMDWPIACLLTDESKKRRRDTIVEPLFNNHQELRPLGDGYALRFPGDMETAARLLDFIAGERACCPFFTFELIFEPGNGPIWLHLRGPAGTKEFVSTLLSGYTYLP